MFRNPDPRPRVGRSDQRLLHRVLAPREVAIAVDEDAEHLRRQPSQDILNSLVQRQSSPPPRSISGHTSRPPPYRTPGYERAISNARDSSSTSTAKYEPTNSFASRYGPSVTTTASCTIRTDRGRWTNPSTPTSSPDWRSSSLNASTSPINASRSAGGKLFQTSSLP